MLQNGTSLGSRGLGLYLHLPFCTHRCSYCDFFSSAKYTEDQFAPVIQGISREIDAIAREFNENDWQVPKAVSVFLGGGTPSLFPVPLVAELFQNLYRKFPWALNAEVSMECNPETLSVDYLNALRAHTPVNRISMGSQSFQPKHLKTLERNCSPDQVRQAAAWVRAAGFSNFNLDLIFGIPGQTMEEVLSDIDEAAKQGPSHISFYQLTLGSNHKLHAGLPEEEFMAEAYEEGVRRLESHGYETYEISNFSKPGKECLHNRLYWEGGDFIGIGPSASSRIFVDGTFRHRKQVADLAKYLSKETVALPAWEGTTPEQTFLEATFLEMRTREGVELEDFHRRYHFDLLQSKKLPLFEKEGLVKKDSRRLRLTPKGRLLADGICRDLADY